MPKKPKVLLMDANVLIDYQKSDFSVLGLVNKHVAEVHVLTTIIEEVDGLDSNIILSSSNNFVKRFIFLTSYNLFAMIKID